jgi:hypothetical protein
MFFRIVILSEAFAAFGFPPLLLRRADAQSKDLRSWYAVCLPANYRPSTWAKALSRDDTTMGGLAKCEPRIAKGFPAKI